MVKPIGANVLVRVIKKKSSIELLPGTKTTDEKDLTIIVEEVGTKCALGVKKGHEAIMANKLSAVVVEQTDEYDLIIIPETSVLAVKNWTEG